MLLFAAYEKSYTSTVSVLFSHIFSKSMTLVSTLLLSFHDVKTSIYSKFFFSGSNVSFEVPVKATTSSFSSLKTPIFSEKEP